MFGNILELHELTMKVQRMLEDAIEMSDTPCVGAGLWELAEAHEFDVYIAYMVSFSIRLISPTKYGSKFLFIFKYWVLDNTGYVSLFLMIYFKDLFKGSLTTVVEKVLNDAKYEQFFMVNIFFFIIVQNYYFYKFNILRKITV